MSGECLFCAEREKEISDLKFKLEKAYESLQNSEEHLKRLRREIVDINEHYYRHCDPKHHL